MTELTPGREPRFGLVGAACGLVGVLAAAGAWTASGIATADATRPLATEEYGRRLLSRTSELLGPDHPDPAMRYSGSRLACTSVPPR